MKRRNGIVTHVRLIRGASGSSTESTGRCLACGKELSSRAPRPICFNCSEYPKKVLKKIARRRRCS